MATVDSMSIESILEIVQNRDLQMDDQVTYFDAAEELAFRVSNLVACVRREDNRPARYHHGRLLYTDEILEALADHAV